MLWKCTQYTSKFGKLSSGHRTGKGQFSFQSQRNAMPNNVQTTAQLHSLHMLARSCSISFKWGFNSTWTENSDVQAEFRKGRGTRDQIPNIHWIIEKAREFQNIHLFIDDTKAFDSMDHKRLWIALKAMRIPDQFTCLLRNLYAGQEATVRILYGTTDWLKIEKGVWQGYLLYYLTRTLSTSWEMLGWMSYKLESR